MHYVNKTGTGIYAKDNQNSWRENKLPCKHIYHQSIYHDVTTLGSLRYRLSGNVGCLLPLIMLTISTIAECILFNRIKSNSSLSSSFHALHKKLKTFGSETSSKSLLQYNAGRLTRNVKHELKIGRLTRNLRILIASHHALVDVSIH